MTTKRRLSAFIDDALMARVERSVEHGSASSVSAWANDAFLRKLEHEQSLEAMADFLRSYEAEFGKITEAEMTAATRSVRKRAVVVRAGEVRSNPSKRRTA